MPGTVLADRYRIYGLLGAGGMGEVYRADDLKLGQPVALKFLPETMEKDGARLARFLNEVRLARQISHQNVCRVYDVGEVDSHHFISMEYVDGEDLSSLLRRIGRVPKDKAIQIARQLCGGLAAAHDQGILHRDLKPANVMIDGRGRARITDFGLAALAEELQGQEVRAGTPAYMSPEQHAGKEVTVRSDVYALGLVLYELFTGQRAFRGATSQELHRLKQESTPAIPSSLVENLDAAVERVILRCLESDPKNRPSSAVMVAAALPGGDPLAAAVAAGETPSPELVAEAGAVGGLRPAAAAACAVALLIGVISVIQLSSKTQLSRIVPLPKPPEVLAERAREILRRLGPSDLPVDSDYRFDYSKSYVDYLIANVPSPAFWERLGHGPPNPILFWYRQSPTYLVPEGKKLVYFDNPPARVAGMAGVMLEPDGRLRQLEVVPPEQDASTGPWPEPSWSSLFEEAGLDPAGFKRVEPTWSPSVYADSRAAWEGAYPGVSEAPIRVEAAGFHGKPVSFRIIGPWTRPIGTESPATDLGGRLARVLLIATIVGLLIGSVLLALRNLRLGRGDRRGATTLAICVLSMGCVAWVLAAHHTPELEEMWLFFTDFAFVLLISSVCWVFYLALEPYVRRLWPEVLVSWVRLLDGRLRDPLVGRDIVLGLLMGLGYLAIGQSWTLASRWLGLPVPPFDQPPYWKEFENLSGLRFALGNLFEFLPANFFFVVVNVVSLVLFRIILRRQRLAIAGFLLFWTISNSLATPNPSVALVFAGSFMVLWLFVFLRLGFLAILVAAFEGLLFNFYPMTLDFTSWYAANTIVVLLVIAALAAHGLRVSLAGRPVFHDSVFQDRETG